MFSARIRWLSLSISVFAALHSASLQAAPYSDRFDPAIRRAVKEYWGDFPFWLWWKAQLIAESDLDPTARSPVGAMGLAQFMPATWAETTRRLGYEGASPYDPSYAIAVGAFYMARLRGEWRSPRPPLDRQYLAIASYNAGLGNLLSSQKLCGNPNLYADIACCLPAVTGRHSVETLRYVERIKRVVKELSYAAR